MIPLIADVISSPIMSAPHSRIVYAPPPKRRRAAKARPSRQEVPAIVGPEPQPPELDTETLALADKAEALFRELVRQASSVSFVANLPQQR